MVLSPDRITPHQPLVYGQNDSAILAYFSMSSIVTLNSFYNGIGRVILNMFDRNSLFSDRDDILISCLATMRHWRSLIVL